MPHEKTVLYNEDIAFLRSVKEFIDRNLDRDLSNAQLSKEFAIGQRTLNRHFSSRYGLSISDYVLQVRMETAMLLIKTRSAPIAQIVFMVGYNYRTSFTHAFTKFHGKPPNHYLRKRGSG